MTERAWNPNLIVDRVAEVRRELGSAIASSGNVRLLQLWPHWDSHLLAILEQGRKRPEVPIALLGGAGSGKSTLINALIGRRLLPMADGKPCTSAVTEVAYHEGPRYEAVVTFTTREEWRREFDLILNELAEAPPDHDDSIAPPVSLSDVKKSARDKVILIEELVKWENSNNPDVINRARAEIARCVASRKIETGEWAKDFSPVAGTKAWDFNARHAAPEAVNALLAEHAPPVYDPFCGGGSIPLEAQRLGLRAYASDLNPVPVLITKALTEIPPKFAGQAPVNPEVWKRLETATYPGATGLAEDVRYYGKWMRDEAKKRIGGLFPTVEITPEDTKGRDELKDLAGMKMPVIAWLWARTITCPNPGCRTEIPMIRSLSLSIKRGKQTWVKPIINLSTKKISYEVKVGGEGPQAGTMRNRSVNCLVCNSTSSLPYIRAEAQSGRMGSSLLAIVVQGQRSRFYVSPNSRHEELACGAQPKWKPGEKVTTPSHDVDRLPMYGMYSWGDAFTKRQLVLLTTLTELLSEARLRALSDATGRVREPSAYADAVATYLGLGASKVSDYNSTLVIWSPSRDQAKGTFARQAISMSWDFAEVNPLAKAAGDIEVTLDGIADLLERLPARTITGDVRQRDARSLPAGLGCCICTDPPYYDNIGYADLSDYFYVWLRRSLGPVYPELFGTLLTPKSEELIASPYRFGGDRDRARSYFESGLGQAFARMHATEHPDYPLTVFYAFKQSETEDDVVEDEEEIASTVTASTGWETMLEGLIKAGFSITGTWPMRTERGARSISIGTNALASSIVLVCHPRPTGAPTASRREFISTLRRDLPNSLRNLQHGNIAPVDLAQASIGPGMAVFTRYTKVIESDGSPMSIRTALQLINQVLDEVLAEQEGEFDSDTRWAIAWFDQYGVDEGPFGTAETLSKAKNTSVAGLSQAGLLTAKGGKVRLLRRDELPEDWNPATDTRRTVWEVTQHLILALEKQGEAGAAALLRRVGEQGEVARDLAYRLYSTCERKKWASEALAYNSLVIAWPQIARLARSSGEGTKQAELF